MVSRGIVAVGTTPLIVLIANISDSEVIIEPEESLGMLESLITPSDEALEVLYVEATLQAFTNEKAEQNANHVEKLKQTIPKLDVDLNGMSSTNANAIAKLILKYKDLFDTTATSYGAAKGVEHTIELTSNKPINQVPHRVSPVERQIINEMTNEMLATQVIRPSTSQWASPVVLVKKNDGKQRFCIDFRKLNQIKKRDVYPIPRIDDCLDALGGNTLFSTFDMHAGYWQIPMKEQDKSKTAFITTEGLFEFNVIPFGLTNATATFQRYVDMVLAGLKWTSLLVYLDDVFVFSKTVDDHIQRLESTFARFRAFKLKLNAAKCHILKRQFIYLGHIVSDKGINPDPKKLEAILKMPSPKTVRQLRSFLGFCNYYRKFIKNYSMQYQTILIGTKTLNQHSLF